MSQDKIAEHIVTEEDNLHLAWVYNRLKDTYNENCNIDFMRRFSSIISKIAVNLNKHEPKQEKGEIMKSIELSDATIGKLIHFLDHTIFVGERTEYYHALMLALNNAKPVEQTWSEAEIKAESPGLNARLTIGDVNRFIKGLKTPKPEMREMNASELSEWLCTLGTLWDVLKLEWRHIGSTFVYTAKALENNTEDEKEYRLTPNAPWLPIPQIEKEK